MARPKLDIDEQLIWKLAKIQCTYDEMAAVVGCHPDTLSNRFSDLINKAREQGKRSLRRAQWKAALGGNTGMLIWLGKQYLGQKDRQDVTSDDKPLVNDEAATLREQLNNRITALAKKNGSNGR